MKIYSYRIDHDFGLAPNPFGKYCTIAVCKPSLRKSKNLNIGDWIIGTGSKSLEKSSGFLCVSKLIFAMKVSEILSLTNYWNDSRFKYKKPVMNGTLTTMFGDNFYFRDINDNWVQLDCAHRNPDGVYDDEHFRKDTSGENALISEEYYYFGDNAPQIPKYLINVCHTTQGVKIVKPQELANHFKEWLQQNYELGLRGLPISWAIYNK